MKFLSISINNFLTIGSAKIELDDRGLLLIQGTNEDDSSAESNGAGKSSIVDALCWALYGTTARGETGDAVVNDAAKKDCRVTVDVEDGAARYYIARHRKHSGAKNALTVARIDGGSTIDMSKGTDKETQEVVNQIIGCSYEVFTSAIYAGQEMMPDLPGMTDKLLKTLIEEAAGVEVLTQAYTVARNRWTTAKTQLDIVVSQQASNVAGRAALNAELTQMEEGAADFEAGRQARAKAELAKVLPINDEIADFKTELAAIDELAVQKELDECDAKLNAQKAEQAKLDALNEEANKAQREQDRAQYAAKMHKDKIVIAERKLAEVDLQVGKACSECGKVYAAEDMAGARAAIEASVAKLKGESPALVKALQDAIAAQKSTAEAAAAFKAGMTDISAVAKRQRQLTLYLSSAKGYRSDIALAERKIEQIKQAASVRLTEANPWTKAVEAKKDEIKRNDEAQATTQVKIDNLQVEVELLADAVKVFGPAGVRAHILDTVTPYLNDRTQDYLGALSDGNIHAVWSTLSKTAKGELREKFNIEVTNDKGAKSFKGLSGGEKRKVRLATAMALQDMVASRATKPIDLFIADEVDHALDESGLERLMGVLERKAKERGTVLVISHNALSDWIDSVITVTKKGGKATVSGAAERGF